MRQRERSNRQTIIVLTLLTAKLIFITYLFIHPMAFNIASFIRRPGMAMACIAGACALLCLLLRSVPTGWIPDEDVGAIKIDVTAPSGYTQHKTDSILARISNRVGAIPAVQEVGAVAGFSFSGTGSSYGSCFVQLKPWGGASGSEPAGCAGRCQCHPRTRTRGDGNGIYAGNDRRIWKRGRL